MSGASTPTGRGRPTGWREFSRTWWSQAWVGALEANAALDPNRLGRGRTYARAKRVSDLEIGPGVVEARVRGSRPRPYGVMIGLATFDGREWDEALDAIAARAAHTAALLDGEITPEIVDDVASVGLDLLPSGRDLRLVCSCPDWAVPCKHAAAVCYEVAARLDDDPFLLLLLRGRTRDQVLEGLRERRRAAAEQRSGGTGSEGTGAGRGLVARDVWAAPHRPVADVRAAAGALVPAIPRRPGRPAPLVSDPPASAALDAEGLAHLARDAALRAWMLLGGDTPSGDERHEIARRAADLVGVHDTAPATGLDHLAAATGIPRDRLRALGRSWAAGGDGAVDVVEDDWRPERDDLAAGIDALSSGPGGGPGGVVRVRGNRVGPLPQGWVQLRLGQDLRWYRLEREHRHWTVTEPPSSDPHDLVG